MDANACPVGMPWRSWLARINKSISGGAMEVIDREPHAWFLIRDGNALLLEARRSHGPADYSVALELSALERRRYDSQGHAYLDKLAYAIHYSAPGVRGNRSVYAHRLLEPLCRQAVSDTILA